MLGAISTGFKSFMDIFGSTILVPIVVFILSLILKVKAKDAFRAAIFMAIGLTAFGLILNILWGQMDTIMSLMSANIGRTFDVIDVGWPAASTIVYNNSLGMFYLIIGLVWNVVLFLTKVTDSFQPTDIWNYYQFCAYAGLVQFATGSFALGMFFALFSNLYVLILSDIIGPALQEYYGYDGLTCTCYCCTASALLAAPFKLLFDKIGFGKVKVDPDTIQQRLGFLGEPAMIGVFLGIVMGILAYVKQLGTLASWSAILAFAFTLAAMLVIYPTVSGLFVRGLIPISNTMNARMRTGEIKRDYFLIGIDPAVYFGETANVTSGVILMAVFILTAVLIPGNRMIPLADVPAVPFMCIGLTLVFQGDILKSVITGAIWGSCAHLVATDCSALFTEAAKAAGFAMEEGQSFVISWLVSCSIPLYILYKGFIAAGALRYVMIAIFTVIYLVWLWHFKKHRRAWYKAFGASDEYLDGYMSKGSAE